jgi:hypothetical protein
LYAKLRGASLLLLLSFRRFPFVLDNVADIGFRSVVVDEGVPDIVIFSPTRSYRALIRNVDVDTLIGILLSREDRSLICSTSSTLSSDDLTLRSWRSRLQGVIGFSSYSSPFSGSLLSQFV